MEFKMYYTLIKKDAVIGKKGIPINEYARGVIYGVMTACAEEHKRYSILPIDEGKVYRMVGTEQQYADFKQTVENMYPNACIFNYDYKK